MSLFKKYSVQRPGGDVLGEFNTAEAADTFQLIMAKRGEQCTVVTQDGDAQDELMTDEEHVTYDIEGLEPDASDPTPEFGSDLDDYNEDELDGFDRLDVDNDDL